MSEYKANHFPCDKCGYIFIHNSKLKRHGQTCKGIPRKQRVKKDTGIPPPPPPPPRIVTSIISYSPMVDVLNELIKNEKYREAKTIYS